ncbi:MAG: hypothetical protein RLY78_2090 [Pseudomonadota bacterium]|jgi:phospholipase/lecithinase/hemolysin
MDRIGSGLRTALLAASLGLSAAGAQAYSAVYAFGDSLSDNGNLYAATSALASLSLLPQALPQSADYWNGRFSNGPVAVEVLAGALGVPLLDMAYGGATTALTPSYPTPLGSFNTGVSAQVSGYLGVTSGVADASGLYVVWAGANDLRDAFAGLADPTLTLAQLQTQLSTASSTVIGNLVSSVTTLYAAGARDFLLPTLPDFGLTPEGQAAQSLIPTSVFSLSDFSTTFDAQLTLTYQALELALPGATLTVFDTLAIQRAVYADPAAYGIGDVDTPCFSGYVGVAGAQCAAGFATDAMFWDKVHPSAVTHEVLGEAMAAELMASAVPEPSALLSMAAGVLLLIGVSARRQRRG